ncbi:MAG: DUF3987 domain-containing protein, partial [Thermomicrobiales bacterium]
MPPPDGAAATTAGEGQDKPIARPPSTDQRERAMSQEQRLAGSPSYQDAPPGDADFALSPEHQRWIADRAIASDVARDRGYRTVYDPAELAALGFAEYQRRMPGLLMPSYDVHGKNGNCHYRPDDPRRGKGGKLVKYETPAGARLTLDVPKPVQRRLSETDVPLWVTEGEGKVDAALSHGIECVVGLSGVWGWRGTARNGAKGPLGDWESIELTDRTVVLAFDSDVMTKASVRLALDRITAFLRSRRAHVRFLLLPDKPDGSKMGLDDYLAAGHSRHDLEQLIVDALPTLGIVPYPVDVLPPLARNFVREASVVLGAPPEFVGVPLLVAAAGVIGNRRYIEAKEGFPAPLVLWSAVVGEPGTAKTPAATAVVDLVTALQATATDDWERTQTAYERDLAGWKDAERRDKAGLPEPKPPVYEHFLTTDSTKEALAEMAATSPGVLLYRDELSAWVGGFDAYRSGRGGDRADMLSSWSGGMLKIDRKGKPPLVARHPAISVCGGIQPDRLSVLAGEVGNDGFLDRFLFAYPEASMPYWSTARMERGTIDAMQEVFSHLRVDSTVGRVPIRFSPETSAAWQWWFDGNTDATNDAPPELRGLLSKLPSHVLRLAGVLHCLAHPKPTEDVLDTETLEAAIALADYHVAHAGRVIERLRRGATDAGRNPRMVRILRILRTEYEKKSGGWIQHGELLRALGNIPTRDLRRELETLVHEGIVERNEIVSLTRKGDEWRLTPIAPPHAVSTHSYDSNHSKDSGVSA